LLEIHRL